MAVQIIGLREANAALRRLPEYAQPGVQAVMNASAFQVQRGAVARVRRRTGFLQMRIAWQARPRTLSSVVGVESEAFYWKFLEYGTVKMEASPFMRPAAEAVTDHESRLVKALTDAANKMERSAGSRLL